MYPVWYMPFVLKVEYIYKTPFRGYNQLSLFMKKKRLNI